MTSSSQGPYKVVHVGTLVQQLGEIASRAAEHGIKVEFLATLRQIEQRLASDPASWGDQICTCKAAGLKQYHRLYEMLSIRYAVDETNRVVYLKACKPVLSHPLAEP